MISKSEMKLGVLKNLIHVKMVKCHFFRIYVFHIRKSVPVLRVSSTKILKLEVVNFIFGYQNYDII